MSKNTPPVRGRLSLHPRGFGFLALEGDAPDLPPSLFVPPPELRGFLDGDLVEARLVPDAGRGPSARGLTLLGRDRRELFGEVVQERGKRVLRPDPTVSSSEWPFLAGVEPPPAGAVIVARLEGEALVAPELVRPEEAGLVRVLVRWSVPRAFPPECQGPLPPLRPPAAHRRDLRELPTITIDGPSTRDIDDALAVLPPQPDGGLRVLVSISDVDARVAEGSPLDLEARRRGTSVYLPDRVVNMLPPALSEEALSLLPGQDRPALTVELRIAPDGQLLAADPFESLIRSHARLTYDEAAAYLDEGKTEGVPEPVRATLRWLRTAAARLSAVRQARGGVSVLREEAHLQLDAAGREPQALIVERETCAHRLVERLMVAANEAVAEWLARRGLPGAYRVHDEPSPERVAELADVAGHLGFETAFGDRLSPHALRAFEAQFETSSRAPAMRTVLRRVLGPARYQVEPAGHFGLAAPLYLHFTSPIRRYADLAVHRIVKAHLAGQRDQVAEDPRLGELCAQLNARDGLSSRAEAERTRQLVARWFAGRLGTRYAANVIAVKPFGLVVQLAGLGVTGTVASETLAGGPFQVDRDRQALVGAGGVRWSVGDPLELELVAADEALGRIELAPRG